MPIGAAGGGDLYIPDGGGGRMGEGVRLYAAGEVGDDG